jgi:hypothetical protein
MGESQVTNARTGVRAGPQRSRDSVALRWQRRLGAPRTPESEFESRLCYARLAGLLRASASQVPGECMGEQHACERQCMGVTHALRGLPRTATLGLSEAWIAKLNALAGPQRSMDREALAARTGRLTKIDADEIRRGGVGRQRARRTIRAHRSK